MCASMFVFLCVFVLFARLIGGNNDNVMVHSDDGRDDRNGDG